MRRNSIGDIQYREMLENFWVATRDPENDWWNVKFSDLGLEEQERIRLEMERELRDEEDYHISVGEYYYNQRM